jgi:flagellar basal-body rod modification protein FlgD
MDTGFRIQSIVPKVPTALKSNELNEHPEEEFVKLMVAQLQNQDPDKPMDGTQLISQMVQMNAAIAMQRMSFLNNANNAVNTAASLLGKQVTLEDSKTGAVVTGRVGTVDYSGDSPTIAVNGKSYPLDSVSRVDQ